MKIDRLIHSSIVAAAFATGTTVALAQSQPGTTAPQGQDRTTQRDTQKDQKHMKQAQGQAPKLKRVSELTGKLATGTNVIGSDNEKLGDIHHIAIDLNSGKVPFVIVSSGGVAGVGADWRAVPAKAIQYSELNETAKLKVTKAEFEAAPKIDKDSWNQLNEDQWRTTTYRYYKIEVDVDRKSDGDIDVDTRRETTKTTTTKPAGGKAMNLVRSDDAIGMDITNAQNEGLGDVNDLVIDLNQSKIAYVVIGMGGFLGMGENLFAVPWQALNLDRTEKQFVINMDKDRLRDAPGFDRNNWPDMADLGWSGNVHAFYGTEPDWVYGYEGEGNVVPQRGASQQSRGWEYNSEYNRQFKANAIETFTGTIANVDRSAPMSNMSEAYVINLRTNEGQTLPVHLGPAWFIDHQPVRFNNGEQLTIQGARVNVNGKECIIATEVRHNNYVLNLRERDGSPAWDVYRTTGSGTNRDALRDSNLENRDRNRNDR